jgi:hypothetical protein
MPIQGRGCNAHNFTTMTNTKKQRGGKRQGAGRKPGVKKARNRIARSITLHRDTWQMIEKKRKELSPSKFIEQKLT